MSDTPAFKSEAQREKWKQLLNDGRVTQESFDARAAATGDTPLPPRAMPRRRTVGPSRGAEASKINDRRY